jgi:hypothetical protein
VRRWYYTSSGERHVVKPCRFCGAPIGWAHYSDGRPYPCVLERGGESNDAFSTMVATAVRHKCRPGRGPKGKCRGFDPGDSESDYCGCGHSIDYHSEATDLCLICPSALPRMRIDGKCVGYTDSSAVDSSCTCGHGLDVHDADSGKCSICPAAKNLKA